jgi:hypothetical protein
VVENEGGGFMNESGQAIGILTPIEPFNPNLVGALLGA